MNRHTRNYPQILVVSVFDVLNTQLREMVAHPSASLVATNLQARLHCSDSNGGQVVVRCTRLRNAQPCLIRGFAPRSSIYFLPSHKWRPATLRKHLSERSRLVVRRAQKRYAAKLFYLSRALSRGSAVSTLGQGHSIHPDVLLRGSFGKILRKVDEGGLCSGIHQ
jgi:hypothetical protein